MIEHATPGLLVKCVDNWTTDPLYEHVNVIVYLCTLGETKQTTEKTMPERTMCFIDMVHVFVKNKYSRGNAGNETMMNYDAKIPQIQKHRKTP